MRTIPFLAALAAAPLAAQQAPPPAPAPAPAPGILDKAVNQPGTNWQLYGAGQKSRLGKTQGVPGNQAMRVDVAAKGANPWDAGALSPVQKPIGPGDAVLVAVYLRAPKLADGQTTPVPFLGLTEAAAPYATVAGASAAVGRDWKLFYASGKAARAYPPGSVRVAVHLAGAAHQLELGPVFVLDFGPSQDVAKLPRTS